ncbi:ankyrin repeat domain-containing protein [Legionella sainthelensi]|uniref:ankyrin repeat domain-containing protein n=1 Tax=Legionella sainthelensi TaxID=28087 RepID=UPI000E202106|nr:ankyrin repeat domain-containing protein [Legionella sainthelensi]
MSTLPMLDILKELQTLQGLQQKSLIFSDKANELIRCIHHDYGDEAASVMKATLQQWGLGDFVEATPLLPPPPLPPHQVQNHDCYQKVLPLCQLALIVERNGVAEDHALKLATIFKDEQAVLHYLLQFKDQNAYNYLVHDACLFELPQADTCAMAQWLKLANLYLANPRFRALLPHAEAIEVMGKMGRKTTKQEGQKFDAQVRDKIQEVKNKLSKVSKQYKQLKKTLTNPAERMARQEKLQALSQHLFNLQTYLVSLCQGRLSLAHVDMIVLEAFYAKYQQESSAAQNILIQNGISPQNREQFYALKRDNAEKTIPDVVIDGKDIGYPGIYIKKLDTTSDKGAALAACLGKITQCCQYLGGAGSECVIHGITSPNGGFYVLCQGEAQNPSLDDAILAQSWVWKGQQGGLCLDSIEAVVRQEKIEQVADMFRLLGHTLCQEHHITHVNTGAQSGITRKVALKDYPAVKEQFQDYAGYCDSKSQLPLACATMPYLFYGKVDSSQLQARIAEDTKRFFQELFSTQEALQNNEALQQVIAFALSTKNDALLQLLGECAANHQEAFDALLATNRDYLHQLDQGIIDFNALEQGAAINAMNKEGQSALHLATLNADKKSISTLIARGINVNIQDKYGNTALIRALEKVLYKDKNEVGRDIAQQLIAAQAQLDIKDNDENTPLIIAVKNKDLAMVNYLLEHGACLEAFDAHMKTALFWAAEKGYEDIFDVLLEHGAKVNGVSNPEENTPLMAALINSHLNIAQKILSQKGVTIRQKNQKGETLIHLAANNSESLKIILALHPENKRLEAVMIQDNYGYTAFHEAADTPESLKTILELYPENQRLEAVTVKSNKGDTALHNAAMSPESLRTILGLLPENQRLRAVMIKNEDGDTVLHLATKNAESLKTVLALLPENQRLDALIIQNNDSYYNGYTTALHLAAKYPESLKTILGSLPEHQRLEAVMIKNKGGDTVLHLAHYNFESLQTILELYPENQRPRALLVKNQEGKTALHLAAKYPENLKTILELLPENQRLEAVLVKTKDDKTSLHLAAENPESLKTILGLLPETHRLEAVMVTNKNGDTVLHLAEYNPESLKTILALHSENQRLEAVMVKNNNGNTALHHAAYKPQSIKSILELLSENQRLQVVLVQNKHSETALHWAVHHSENLKPILELLSDNQRLKAVLVQNKEGKTVLHEAAKNPEILKTILGLLPENHYLEAFLVKSKGGKTALHLAADNPESLKIILGLYPENKRLEAVIIQDNYSCTALHLAAKNHENLKTILELYPENKRLEAIMIQNNYGSTALHLAADHPESLKAALELLPVNQRLEAIIIQNTYGSTALHLAADHPESLKAALELLPVNQRLEAMKVQNNEGKTALHLAISRPNSIKTIFALLPENHHLEAVMVQNKYGKTVLHDAAKNHESLKTILALLPENHRLEAVMVQNKYGETVLHDAAKNPESLKTILALLPENQRLEAVMVQNKDCETVLHDAAKNPESLKTILALLPENQRLEAVMVQNKDCETVRHLAKNRPESLRTILELLPAETDTCSSENKDIFKILTNNHSFFSIPKEYNSDKDLRNNPKERPAIKWV